MASTLARVSAVLFLVKAVKSTGVGKKEREGESGQKVPWKGHSRKDSELFQLVVFLGPLDYFLCVPCPIKTKYTKGCASVGGYCTTAQAFHRILGGAHDMSAKLHWAR